MAREKEAKSGGSEAKGSAEWKQFRVAFREMVTGRRTPGSARSDRNGRIRTRESNSSGPLCACVVHDLCACTTSHDFALTQCRWQLPMERALFGSRSIEGVHPAYVVNTLTIPLGEAQPRPRHHTSLAARFHQTRRE